MYDIIAGTQVVGRAEVIKEGLYYRFSCKCSPPSDGIHRIIVTDGNNTLDLGICVPTGEWFCLVSRVPIKYLSGEDLKFTLVPKGFQNKPLPVATNKPFEELDKLDSAHLEVTQESIGIVIDPVPDQQGSDQSQKPQHKWE